MLMLLLSAAAPRMTAASGVLSQIWKPEKLSAADMSIFSLRTASPNVIAVLLDTDFFVGEYENPVNREVKAWKVNDEHPAKISLYARPFDELEKNALGSNAYPVKMRYWVFLHLEDVLKNGGSYTIESPYGTAVLDFSDRGTRCESIKVNQVGYAGDSMQRLGYLGVYLGDGGSFRLDMPLTFRVMLEGSDGGTGADGRTGEDERTGEEGDGGEIIYTGSVEYVGDDTKVDDSLSSGEYLYRMDLSKVPEGGPYRISVEGFGVSPPFGIGDLYLEFIASTYARGLYHQRCGIALEPAYTDFARETCHNQVFITREPWSKSGFIDVPDTAKRLHTAGGYHDAGDFDRRPKHIQIPVMMLSYFESFPDHFTDGQYDIPESGNGIPDFLDEALWGMKIWEQLQILDEEDAEYGGIMAGTETDGHPVYGEVNAASDERVYGTWEVLPEVSAYGAGIFAQASRLLMQFDHLEGLRERAEDLFERSLLAWDYVSRVQEDTGQEDTGQEDTGQESTGQEGTGQEVTGAAFKDDPKTSVMYAAEQIYLTAELLGKDAREFSLNREDAAVFESVFADHARAIVAGLDEGSDWPEQFRPGNTAAECQAYHFASYLLPKYQNITSPELAAVLREELFTAAESGGYMGVNLEDGMYPQGVSKSYGWGAGTAQGRYADVYAFAYRLSYDERARNRYYGYMSQLGDYALGLNPLGLSYVTGLGSEQVQSPLHLDSFFTKYSGGETAALSHQQENLSSLNSVFKASFSGNPGNVPGILIFGPSEGRSGAAYQRVISDKVYPVWDDLPAQRRWADGWSLVNNNEFTVWETMVWNTCLYGVLYDAD